jgi:SpoIID/LytB domain protein
VRKTACVALCVSALSLYPARVSVAASALPPDASVNVTGHGWGHGRGLGQWGAKGMAATGSTWTQIVTHFYSGVSIGARAAGEDIRVLVESSPDVIMTSDAPFTMWWSNGTKFATSDTTYKFWRISWNEAASAHRVEKATSWKGPWTYVTQSGYYVVFHNGSQTLQLVKDNGNTYWYRGAMIARHASIGGLYAIEELLMEEYLYGVVPREMPSSWPAEALRAQAVAARTYSAYKKDYARSQGYPSDICATTSCQSYLGNASSPLPGGTKTNLEAASTNAAVDATAGKVALYGGKAILAEYSSSTGGYSAPGNVPYQKAVPDPGDAGSPHHDWEATFTVADVEKEWPSIGHLVEIKVTERNGYGDWGGRVDEMEIVGTSSTETLSGSAFRTAFSGEGVKSNWFTVQYWTFDDVRPGAFAFSQINTIAEKGITSGCDTSPPRFCPKAPVTRGEMAVFLLRAMGHGDPSHLPAYRGIFADVPASNPFARYIEHLYDHGITAGCTTGPLRYCPQESVTRGEMAVFLLRGIDHGSPSHVPAYRGIFADVPSTHRFAGFIEHAYDHGITSGCTSSPRNFCPSGAVTRAQMAVFIVNAFGL